MTAASSTGVPGAVSQANSNTAFSSRSSSCRPRRHAAGRPLAPRLCRPGISIVVVASSGRPRSSAAVLLALPVLDRPAADEAQRHDDARRPRHRPPTARSAAAPTCRGRSRRCCASSSVATSSCACSAVRVVRRAGSRPAARPTVLGGNRHSSLRLPHELEEQRQRDRARRCPPPMSVSGQMRPGSRRRAAVAKKYWNTANDPPPTTSAGQTGERLPPRAHALDHVQRDQARQERQLVPAHDADLVGRHAAGRLRG